MPAADIHSPERAKHRIAIYPCLIRQDGEAEDETDKGEPQVVRDLRDMGLDGYALGFVDQVPAAGDDRRQQDDQGDGQGPGPGIGKDEPAEYQQRKKRERQQAAPQVVKDLPAGKTGEPVLHPLPPGITEKWHHPGRYLPVAPDPPVVTADVLTVLRRGFFIQRDVADQPAPAITALEQVMAEDAIVTELVFKGPLKAVYIIYALTNKGPFGEQVLVHIRRQTRIGVDPLDIALHTDIQGGDTRGHLRVDPGLK